MDYPQDFPNDSVTKVEKARIRAGRQFDSKRAKAKWSSDIEGLFWKYVLTPFLVFAVESARLELWPVDEIDRKCREFLRRLVIDAYYQKGKTAGLGEVTSNWNGSILWEVEQSIQKTSQWRKYENIRLKFGGSRRPATQSTAQNTGNSAQTVGGQPTNAASGKPQVSKAGANDDPDVAKRRALVRANPNVSAQEMCEVFDREHVPLPSKWQGTGLRSWIEAYKSLQYRSRIRVLISKDRRTA